MLDCATARSASGDKAVAPRAKGEGVESAQLRRSLLGRDPQRLLNVDSCPCSVGHKESRTVSLSSTALAVWPRNTTAMRVLARRTRSNRATETRSPIGPGGETGRAGFSVLGEMLGPASGRLVLPAQLVGEDAHHP
jgi:hypothetical protein